MKRDITLRWPGATARCGRSVAPTLAASFERFCLAAGMAMLWRDDGGGRRSAVRPAPRARRDRRRIAGAGRAAGSASTAARSRSSGRGFAPSMAGSFRCRAGRARGAEDWLGRWAMNLMLINVSTRRFGRAVRLPGGRCAGGAGRGVSKSAASRRFVALSERDGGRWMAPTCRSSTCWPSRSTGCTSSDDLVLVAAIGIDGEGGKHPLALVEGATENAATVQALLDNLVERGLDPAVCRLFIVDGAKALTKAIRRTFGGTRRSSAARFTRPATSWTGCRRSFTRRSRRALRQAWELDDADKAEKLIRNLARRLEPERAGRGREHPGRARRDPHRRPPRPAPGTASLAGLHQHRREHDGHDPARLPQREALARRRHGAALDRRCHARGVPPPVFETPDCDYAARGIVSIWSRRNWAGERWPWRSISQHSL